MNKLFSCLLIVSISFAFNVVADTNKQLLKDIQTAQRNLDKTQTAIASARTQLARQVREQELKVAKMREQAAVEQRLQDEKTLSLQQLQKRLKSWTEQSQYQQSLLTRFNQQMAHTPLTNEANLAQKLSWLDQHIEKLNTQLYPTWQAQSLVKLNGEIKQADMLRLGPVTWYLDNTTGEAGFATLPEKLSAADNQGNRRLYNVSLPLSQQVSEQLQQLQQTGQGNIYFDPSLTRAIKVKSQQESLLEHVTKGGIWVVPIIAFGLFAIVIALFKAMQLWRLPKLIPAFSERVAQLAHIPDGDARQSAAEGLFDSAKGMQKELIEIAKNTALGQKRDDQLFASLLASKHKLDYWLGAIAITAAVSPLLGLLGTVSGMIETFKLMTLFGAGDPAAVSGGISQALVTTELGLVVAIPALILHALLNRKAKTYYGKLEASGVSLSQLEQGS